MKKIDLDGNGFTEEDVDHLQAAFGERLGEMEDNDDEAEFDDDLESDEEVEDDKGRDGNADADMNALAEAMADSGLV